MVKGRVAALIVCTMVALLAGCASGPRGGSGGSGRDGPGASTPGNLDRTPDAQPRIESIRSSGGTSKPYTVLGQSYVPIVDDRPFRESGLASWYGTRFHAQSTASGEPYDMYAMTAAHKTLPLPSYVRVRNPANGREVIVRVNDRGPFHEGRVIDLSYTAALKLDLLRGVAPVEIERITNDDVRTGAWQRGGGETMAMVTTSPVVARPHDDTVDLPALALPQAVAFEGDGARPQIPKPGFWVQLGAFGQRESAIDFQKRVARQMPTLSGALQVFSDSTVHRVQAGPFASRETAGNTVDQVRNNLQLTPIVVERR